MRYLSLFTGIGGFELGIRNAFNDNSNVDSIDRSPDGKSQGDQAKNDAKGTRLESKTGKGSRPPARRSGKYPNDWRRGQEPPTCVGYSEIDKYAIQVYEKHFPDHKNYGDITKIKAEDLPDFDLLVGGFPCQSFSIAGKRRGFDDTRGTLFFEIARLIKAKRPRLLLLENVRGLLSHDEGATFTTIICALDGLGYDLQWQVLNSKNHGVPQNRERIFIVGHLRGTARPQVFPSREHGEEIDELPRHISNTLTARYEGAQAVGTYIGEGKQYAQKIRIPEATRGGYAEAEIGDSINLSVMGSKTRRGRVGKGIAQTLDTGMQQYTMVARNQRGEIREMEISGSLTGNKSGKQFSYLMQRSRGKNKGGMHKIAPTMTGSSYQDNNHLNGIRRLTPTECERLQGFPDGWTEGISDTQRYKTLGNAVTVNVIRDIMEKMI